MKFSANLGLLWSELPLLDRVYKAKKTGFDAIEFQFPYEVDANELKKAIDIINLPIIGINTIKGNVSIGDNGLNAVPSKIKEAREAIDQAIEYAKVIGAKNIHCMGGITEQNNDSLTTFVENLKYAARKLKDLNIGLVIEPKNQKDFPGYFLTKVEQAKEICELVGNNDVKIMFDFYHVQINQGNVLTRFRDNFNFIGHVQMASVPDRNEPIFGELNYSNILSEIYKFGYQGYIGAEYNPLKNTDEGLSWMKSFNKEDK